MDESFAQTIRECYWQEREDSHRIPIESSPVSNPKYQYEIKASLRKDRYVFDTGLMQMRAQDLAQDGIRKERQETIVKLVWSLDNIACGIYDLEKRIKQNSNDLFIFDSDMMEDLPLMAINEHDNLNYIQPQINAYSEPLIVFEGYKHKIELNNIQDEEDRISFLLNYDITWDNVYEVTDVTSESNI